MLTPDQILTREEVEAERNEFPASSVEATLAFVDFTRWLDSRALAAFRAVHDAEPEEDDFPELYDIRAGVQRLAVN